MVDKTNRKVSTSSEEPMDISDESDNALLIDSANFVEQPGPSLDEAKPVNPTEQAEEIIKLAEKSRARLYETLGKMVYYNITDCINTTQIDQDYQMIDGHVDEALKCKIQCFEYVEFSKLISKNRMFKEEGDQRMEILTRNGMTYLAPISDREAVQINNYGKWEQAFRVYSNILTSRYPGKSTELLQYNHTIIQHPCLTCGRMFMYTIESSDSISAGIPPGLGI